MGSYLRKARTEINYLTFFKAKKEKNNNINNYYKYKYKYK